MTACPSGPDGRVCRLNVPGHDELRVRYANDVRISSWGALHTEDVDVDQDADSFVRNQGHAVPLPLVWGDGWQERGLAGNLPRGRRACRVGPEGRLCRLNDQEHERLTVDSLNSGASPSSGRWHSSGPLGSDGLPMLNVMRWADTFGEMPPVATEDVETPAALSLLDRLAATADLLEAKLFEQEAKMRGDGYDEPWLVAMPNNGPLILLPVLQTVVEARTTLARAAETAAPQGTRLEPRMDPHGPRGACETCGRAL